VTVKQLGTAPSLYYWENFVFVGKNLLKYEFRAGNFHLERILERD